LITRISAKTFSSTTLSPEPSPHLKWQIGVGETPWPRLPKLAPKIGEDFVT